MLSHSTAPQSSSEDTFEIHISIPTTIKRKIPFKVIMFASTIQYVLIIYKEIESAGIFKKYKSYLKKISVSAKNLQLL